MNKVKQIKKNVQRSIIAIMAMILIVGSFDLTVIHAANRVTTGDRYQLFYECDQRGRSYILERIIPTIFMWTVKLLSVLSLGSW